MSMPPPGQNSVPDSVREAAREPSRPEPLRVELVEVLRDAEALVALVKTLAREHGSSLSQEAHDLIREAVELHEDRGLDDLAENRRRSWNPKTALTAAEVRAQLKGR